MINYQLSMKNYQLLFLLLFINHRSFFIDNCSLHSRPGEEGVRERMRDKRGGYAEFMSDGYDEKEEKWAKKRKREG